MFSEVRGGPAHPRRMTNQTIATSGAARVIHDRPHQMPPCPNSADNSPKIDNPANAMGQPQILSITAPLQTCCSSSSRARTGDLRFDIHR